MKFIISGCFIVMLSLLFPFSHSLAGDIDENLKFFEPLLGKQWTGGYVGSDSPEIEIVLSYEKILDGQAVKYVRKADAVNFSSLTHFFWNPGRKEVSFITLNNKGIVEEGIVKVTESRIILTGTSHRPNQSIEFKTILEIESNGTLKDSFQRMVNGKWVQGHLQQFSIKE